MGAKSGRCFLPNLPASLVIGFVQNVSRDGCVSLLLGELGSECERFDGGSGIPG